MENITFTVEPRKRFWYFHLEDNKYSLLEDTGMQTNKHRILLDNSIPNRKVFIKLSNVNFLWNEQRLFEATHNRLPIANGYHIGKEHKEDTIDLLTRLNRI